MRRRGAVTLALPLVWLVAAAPGAQAPHVTRGERPSTSWLDQYREPASRLIGEAVGSTFAWQRLAVLTDSIGHRLSGTPALDRVSTTCTAKASWCRNGCGAPRAPR
jgi:hypothetical protein